MRWLWSVATAVAASIALLWLIGIMFGPAGAYLAGFALFVYVLGSIGGESHGYGCTCPKHLHR